LGLFVRQVTDSRRQFAQMEALQGVLHTLDPVLPLPATRGWAASPDLLREIVLQVLTEPTELVVEASSGTSSLVLGYCMKRLGKGRVVSLEHDPEYAARTRKAVRDHGLEAHVTVLDAPLVEHTMDGQRQLWYDLSALVLPGPVDLLVVDGPPDTVQPLARYPALPLLRHHLASGARVLLDDGDRQDERAMAKRWAGSCPGASLHYLDFEAGAWLLRLNGRSPDQGSK
jgi:hypothetical protein